MPASTPPSHARAVIIGGGIVGCSVAYHLAKLGWSDVVLVERAQLTSGSTFHAAGLVGQLRSSANITQLLQYSVELYDILEAETEQATGWRQCGGLRLACNEERWTEVRRQATTARSFGLEMHLLSPAEAKKMWPLMQVDDLVGAAFLPTDGQVSPSDISQAMAKGARMRGVRCLEDCPVEAILIERGRAVGVRTAQGEIRSDVVVNCAGVWARQIGAMAGVCVPVTPMQHQFMITEPIEGVAAGLPTLRDPDRLVYFKEEVGGLVAGGYELNPKPWAQSGIPNGWTFKLIEPDWEHFEQLAAQALERVPALETAGVRQLINGPEAFTPDGSFLLGEAPELPGFFVGAGFNAYGIAAAGGAGRALAEWIVEGVPQMDLWPVDIRRFSQHHRDAVWSRGLTIEAYAHHYTMSWPHEEHEAGRPLRRSPLYQRLRDGGACFGTKLGWERPNWFAPQGVEPVDEYTYGYQNWFAHVGEEHRATRESVALFDETSFAKFMLLGKDVEAALSWICSAEIRKPPGACIYTQMLNARGGIECDLTVTRLAPDAFYLITGTGYSVHDADWIVRNIPDGMDVRLVDVTSQRAVIGLMGPRSRDVLAAVADVDMSNEAFPYLTWQTLRIAGAEVWAMRVTFVGELGWELHVPAETALTVYDVLRAAGEAHGIRDAGYRAIESLRLEKGYRVWSRDITPDNTPLEAGLGWNVKLRTEEPFSGRDAVLAQKRDGLRKRLACFTVDDRETVLLGRETIYRDGERVGWLTSGGYGYTVGKPIGYGYVRRDSGVDRDFVLSGRYELEVAGDMVPCAVHLRPLYDPSNERVRG
ncbi:MAG: FAD-dependent oxidoreductase [Planctomycetota bacterium]